jgi:hypothetical protein
MAASLADLAKSEFFLKILIASSPEILGSSGGMGRHFKCCHKGTEGLAQRKFFKI